MGDCSKHIRGSKIRQVPNRNGYRKLPVGLFRIFFYISQEAVLRRILTSWSSAYIASGLPVCRSWPGRSRWMQGLHQQVVNRRQSSPGVKHRTAGPPRKPAVYHDSTTTPTICAKLCRGLQYSTKGSTDNIKSVPAAPAESSCWRLNSRARVDSGSEEVRPRHGVLVSKARKVTETSEKETTFLP